MVYCQFISSTLLSYIEHDINDYFKGVDFDLISLMMYVIGSDLAKDLKC